MEEKVKKMLYDNVENPWEFVVKASKKYKEEFVKTSKIGRAPSVDAIMGAYIADITEGSQEEKPSSETEDNKE